MKAEEFLNEMNKKECNIDKLYYDSYVRKAMIEFAKHHVQKALESVKQNIILVENMRTNGEEKTDSTKFHKDYDFYIKEESILESYPLDNID